MSSVQRMAAAVEALEEALRDVTTLTERLVEEAGELSEEAAGHGWGAIAQQMQNAGELFGFAAVKLRDVEHACERTLSELRSIDHHAHADDVSTSLATSSSQLETASEQITGAVELIEEAQSAMAAVGQQGMISAIDDLLEQMHGLQEQIADQRSTSKAEHNDAEAYAEATTRTNSPNQPASETSVTRPETQVDVPRPRPRNLADYEKQRDWAVESYAFIRSDQTDAAIIVQHLRISPRPSGTVGFTEEEVAEIKQHVFIREQRIEDYESGEVVTRRFDADEDMASAWLRLRAGKGRPSDLVLLEHELSEISHLKAVPDSTYQQAHAAANGLYNWQSLVEEG